MQPSEADLRTFVGPNADYYLMRWQSFRDGSGPWSRVNVSALVFTGLWCFYRRMYLIGVCVWLGGVALGWAVVLAAFLVKGDAIGGSLPIALASLAANLAVPLSFGLLANYIYYQRAVRCIDAVRRRTSDPAARLEQIRQAGATRFFWVGFSLLLSTAVFATVLMTALELVQQALRD